MAERTTQRSGIFIEIDPSRSIPVKTLLHLLAITHLQTDGELSLKALESLGQ